MKFKKEIVNVLFFLTGIFIHLGSTSFLTIGAEEMPEAIKRLR